MSTRRKKGMYPPQKGTHAEENAFFPERFFWAAGEYPADCHLIFSREALS